MKGTALAEELARIHAASFASSGLRAWSANEFAALLAEPGVVMVACDATGVSSKRDVVAFAVLRRICDEAELLTLAVEPEFWRRGLGDRLMFGLEDVCRASKVRRIIAEVASNNLSARSLYAKHGLVEIAVRRGYYRAANATFDACVLERRLT